MLLTYEAIRSEQARTGGMRLGTKAPLTFFCRGGSFARDFEGADGICEVLSVTQSLKFLHGNGDATGTKVPNLIDDTIISIERTMGRNK